jgi:UDPglucose 6-dehydrogenase
MKVTIFGTGYVGLVTGACLAEMGNHVVCVDVDQAKVEGLRNGIIPIFEPGLEPIVKRNYASGQLDFTTDAAPAIAHGELIFIAVGTPPDEDGSADLKYVLSVARTIGTHLDRYAVIVNKSTVPVGTADRVRGAVSETLKQRGAALDFDVVSNPEFLKEGDAVEDCLRPDRIVVGSSSDRAVARLRKLYAPFNRNHDRMVVMDERSAELTKYAANAVGADVELVRQGIGADPRIGYHFIYPGAGYGGSCFPKDVQALERIARGHGYDARLLNMVEAVNTDQKTRLFAQIHRHFDGDIAGKTVAVWGLAFKPNTDDMREAPSRRLLEALWEAGVKVRAYDPEARAETARIYGERDDMVLCENAYDALKGADVLALVTEWKAFRSPDFTRIKAALKTPAIFDGRNLYDPHVVEDAGIAYYGIGRGRSLQR